jgi:hypothetical protein
MKSEKLSKHTLLFYQGDFARLQRLHPDGEASTIIRNLVRIYLDKRDPPVDTSKIKGDVDV